MYMPVKDYFIPACIDCGEDMRRVYNPPSIHMWGDGYHHHGLGEHVSSQRDLKEKMKKKAQEVSERTGVDTEYSIP